MKRRLSAALLALIIATRAFGDGIPDMGDTAKAELTPQAEREYAAAVIRQLRFNEPEYVNDPEIEDYLDRVGTQLVSASQTPGEHYHYFALSDPSINAVSIMGGVLVFNSGLFAAAENESEVAAVMAHEISHIQQHHQARMVSEQGNLSYGMIGAVLLALLASRSSSNAAIGTLLGGQAALQSAALSYSRDYEREADRMGLQMLTAAGYDTRGMVSFFERLDRATRNNDTAAYKYLLTHPLTSERITDTANRVMQQPYRQHVDSIDFTLAKVKLEALNQTPREILDRFANDPPQRPLAAAAHWYARARAQLALKQVDEAWRAYQQLRGVPLASPMIELLGAELRSAQGNHAAALEIIADARLRYPQSRALLYLQIDELLAARQLSEAAKLTHAQLALDPMDDRLWRRSGLVAAAQGKQLALHRSQAEIFYLQGLLGPAIEQLQLGLRAGDGDFYDKSSAEARLARLREQRAQAKRAREGG